MNLNPNNETAEEIFARVRSMEPTVHEYVDELGNVILRTFEYDAKQTQGEQS